MLPATTLRVCAATLCVALLLAACGSGTDDRASGGSAPTTVHDMAGHSHGSGADSWAEVVTQRRDACAKTARFENGLHRCYVDSETVSRYPFDAKATPEQVAAAEDFAARNETYAEKNFADIDDAKAAGYVLDEFMMRLDRVEGTPAETKMRKMLDEGVVTHLQNPTLANDGIAADPEKPDVLMYATNGRRSVLVGSMFLAPIGTDGPQFGGPVTLWHNHDNVADFAMACFDGTAIVALTKAAPDGSMGRTAAEGGCPKGGPPAGTSQMLHVHFDTDALSQTYSGNMVTPELGEILR